MMGNALASQFMIIMTAKSKRLRYLIIFRQVIYSIKYKKRKERIESELPGYKVIFANPPGSRSGNAGSENKRKHTRQAEKQVTVKHIVKEQDIFNFGKRNKSMKRFILPVAFFMITALAASSQQVADTAYSPVIVHPAYAPGSGPSVYIDEGHNNFHTKGERYWPFARLLERDGYRTEGYTGPFTEHGLEGIKILVISNALNEFNVTRWYKPVKSAFSPD